MKKLRLFIRKLLGKPISEWSLRIARDDIRIQRFLSSHLSDSSNCIDIGAHKGSFLEFFIRFSPNGVHYAFEPIPEYYNNLFDSYPSVNVFNVALTNDSGNSIFFMASGAEAMSGFKKQDYPVEAQVREIEVKTERLDDYMKQFSSIDFIKIDVEGAELMVLDGAKEVIKTFHPVIMFEFAILHSKEYGYSSDDIYELLSDLNYDIWRLDRKLKFTQEAFIKVSRKSHESGYDRYAETNFLAIPKN